MDLLLLKTKVFGPSKSFKSIKKVPGTVAHTYNPRYAGGAIGSRIMVQGWPQQKSQGPTCKITKAKRTGSVAQVIKHLPSKYKALSSIPSHDKKKNTDKERRNTESKML
jgi:hypothetical protein